MAVFSCCSRPPGPCWSHWGSRKAARRFSPPHSSSGSERRKKPLNQRAVKTTLASLVKRGFVIERGKDKKPIITKAGRAAVGVDAGQTRRGGNQHNGSTSSIAIRPGTKQAQLLSLLSRPDGAAMSEMTKATGWQPHSVRAALTGLRKRGIAVLCGKSDTGTTVYRADAA